MSKSPKLVFLSYAHADVDAVTRVREHLVTAGFVPWMDKFDLRPGQVWRDEIERAIRHSAAFLSMISPSSLDRGGILRGEMKLALDIRAERLDDRGLLIPVRLEHCQLPKDLHDIQTLDWFLPDGPAKLTAALASLREKPSLFTRPWVLVCILALCAAIGAVIYRARPVPAAPRIDLTVWRVTEDNATGTGTCRTLRFTRQSLNQPVRTGDKLRLDVQTSRPGYVYVISREIDDKGTPGAPKLLFPVRMLNEGKNRIVPGRALMIPPASNICQTLQLTHAGAAEQVSILFSEKPLDALPLHDQPWPVDPALAAKLEGAPNISPALNNPAPPSATELPDAESRDLNYTSAGPDAGFQFSAGTSAPLAARFTLKTAP